MLRNAQFALKRAKKTGTTQVYEPTQAQAVRRRFSIETELRCAIEAGDLTLAYQPLIELATGRSPASRRWRAGSMRAIRSRRASSSRSPRNRA